MPVTLLSKHVFIESNRVIDNVVEMNIELNNSFLLELLQVFKFGSEELKL